MYARERGPKKEAERNGNGGRRGERGVKDRIHHGTGSGIVRVNSAQTRRGTASQPPVPPSTQPSKYRAFE